MAKLFNKHDGVNDSQSTDVISLKVVFFRFVEHQSMIDSSDTQIVKEIWVEDMIVRAMQE